LHPEDSNRTALPLQGVHKGTYLIMDSTEEQSIR